MFKLRLTLGTKLLVSFVVVAVLVSFSGAIALYFIKSIEATLNNITDKAAPTVETSDDLIANLWEANKVMQEILVSEIPEEIKVFEKEFMALDAIYGETYKELKEIVDDKDLLDDLEAAKEEQQQFVEHSMEAIEQQLLMLQKEEISKLLLVKFDETGARLRLMLDEFATENEEEMQKAEDEGDALVKSGRATARRLNDILGELFEKDYPVVEASLKLQALTIELQDTCGEYLAEEDIKKLDPIRKEFETIFSQASGFIKILRDFAETSEDKQDAQDLSNLMMQWDDAVLVEDGLFDSHFEMLEAELKVDELSNIFESDVDHAAKALNVVADTADSISDAADEEAASEVQKAVLSVILCFIIGLLVAVLLGYLLAQSITNPMKDLVDVLEAFGRGEMDIRSDIKSSDEIGFFAERFNIMLDQINESAKTLQKSESSFRSLFDKLQEVIKGKEYSFRFSPDSEKDELSLSLNQMMTTLETAETNSIQQNWLKTGQTELSNLISGERDLLVLCQKSITFIAKYIDAQVGTFFVRQGETEEFILVSNYAFKERKGFVNRLKFGEGLAGQAALEKEVILFTEVPEDYIKIESTLGNISPKTILAIPLVFENDVKGIIELGSATVFSKTEVSFIETAGDSLAVALNATMFNEKLEALLDQTKTQASELKEQQEELKVANEELQEQTEILKESEAKLQVQQEELQANNEELEEKTEILETQKAEIEKKNTSLTQKQIEVEEKAKQLELATRYKSEFLANMSHELRTPLNSLLILAHMLADNEENNLTPDQVESANSIHRSGQTLLQLINDILDLSKIEAKEIEFNISTISLKSLESNCTAEFSHMAKEKGLSFEVNMEDELPPSITTDELKLNQIIRNLMGNAVKFTEKGKVSLIISRPDQEIEFERNDLDRETTLAISIADTGQGIPEDKVNLIFQAFKQVDGSISRRHGGTGLGLSISRELASLIGGELTVTSTFGQGTTFTLYIPETFPPEQKIEKTADSFPKAELISSSKAISKENDTVGTVELERNGLSRSKTMLIIEDDNEFAGILAGFFEKNGYQSIIAPDGEIGMKYILEHPPTAVVLDIGLPGIDGWAVLRELKNNPSTRHIPVHIISAFDETRQGLEKGAVGYLTKPVEVEELQKALNRFDSILSSKVKELLIVEDDKELQSAIMNLMKTDDINALAADTGEKALELLKTNSFDCMILDIGLPDISGFELLDIIDKDPSLVKVPVIIYTGRDLSREEAEKLEMYSSSIVMKSASSMERLLDETALFMHRVENDMPEAHQKMIQGLRDNESILPGKKVLLVDDDMRNAFALNKFLKSKGMEVIIANTGKKALDVLEKGEKPDIVLMDIMMPEMDGYEAIRKIRKQNEFKDLPILALTAKAMESDREECIKSGANDYMSKPVDTTKLLAMLRVWLYS